MTGRIVGRIPPEHNCTPGWEPIEPKTVRDQFGDVIGTVSTQTRWCAVGTIVECECGKTWVKVSHNTDQWRREGRFEKWLRLRREALSGQETTNGSG